MINLYWEPIADDCWRCKCGGGGGPCRHAPLQTASQRTRERDFTYWWRTKRWAAAAKTSPTGCSPVCASVKQESALSSISLPLIWCLFHGTIAFFGRQTRRKEKKARAQPEWVQVGVAYAYILPRFSLHRGLILCEGKEQRKCSFAGISQLNKFAFKRVNYERGANNEKNRILYLDKLWVCRRNSLWCAQLPPRWRH
jgi:hypothetical protein